MDLRLHAPTPEVVIVRVSGPVDGMAAGVLTDRVGKQLHRAPHVVLDLGQVSVLGREGLTVLSTLHQQAMARGTQLHIVGADHQVVRQALHSTGLTQLLSRESTADAVIASLPGPIISRAPALPHLALTRCANALQASSGGLVRRRAGGDRHVG